MHPFTIARLIQDDRLWAEVDAALAESPFRSVADVRRLDGVESAIRRLAEARPALVLIQATDSCERWIAELRRAAPDAIIAAIQAEPSAEVVAATRRAGAAEFLRAPIRRNLGALLERMQPSRAVNPPGRAVAVLSAKGGCGSTTVACHAAVAASALGAPLGRRTLLLDLDLNKGLVGFLMRANSETSILDAVRRMPSLEWSEWNSLTTRTAGGLDVLGAPSDVRPGETLDHRNIRQAVRFARTHYDLTIIDVGSGFGQIAAAVLAEISELYLVTTPEISPLHITQQILRSLEEAGYPRGRVRLLLNRAAANARQFSEEIERIIGLKVLLALPNDYKSLYECYSYGRLLPPRSRIARAVTVLAGHMTGVPAQPRRTVLDWFRRKPFARLLPPRAAGAAGDG